MPENHQFWNLELWVPFQKCSKIWALCISLYTVAERYAYMSITTANVHHKHTINWNLFKKYESTGW